MFKQMWIVFSKELKCIFRDKKTFIISLIIPFLLLPSMLFIVNFAMKIFQNQAIEDIRIGVSSKDNSFFSFINAQSGITVVDVEDVDKDLSSGKIYSYIIVDEDIDNKILNNQDFNIDIREGEDASINSIMTSSMISVYVNVFKNDIIMGIMGDGLAKNSEELKSILSEFDVSEYVKDMINRQKKSIDLNSLYFNMLMPMMLVMYCCLGSASTASDLSAGEKERGTIEPLLSTGANRTAIIIGKLLATTVVGMLIGMSTTLGLWGYLIISSSNSVHLSVIEMLAFLIITLFTAMFFAAINLTIGVYSRSYKEAQTYFTPVLVICLAPSVFTYAMDVRNISFMHLSVPVLNIVCIIKEIFAGVINFIHLGIVLSWLLVYVGIAFLVMQRMFKKEEVLFRM